MKASSAPYNMPAKPSATMAASHCRAAAGSSWSEPYPVHRTSWVKQPSIAIVNNIPVICYAPVFGDGLFCASWKNF